MRWRARQPRPGPYLDVLVRDPADWMAPGEAAAVLGLDTRWVHRLVELGHLAAAEDGLGRPGVSRASVERYARDGPDPGTGWLEVVVNAVGGLLEIFT